MTAFKTPAERIASNMRAGGEVGILSHETQRRDSVLARLHRGVTVSDSFAAITSTIASEIAVDRVSLLRVQSSSCILVATSTQPKVDRRTRQARLLERLSTRVLASGSALTYELGSGSTPEFSASELEDYLVDSGTRVLHIERVEHPDSHDPIGFIVLERFRVCETPKTPIHTLLESFREPLSHATSNALDRDNGGWDAIVSRWTSAATSFKMTSGGLIVALVVMAGIFVPMDLEIPVEGVMTATQKRHVFAPHDGVVSSVRVSGGDHVVAGQPLVTIRSPELDLLEQATQSSMATAQARLDALLSLRGRDRDSSLSIEEQSLRTEIAGLQQQAELILTERDALLVKSPIDGRVDGWELQQAFESRPVSRGQFLMDVVTPNAGWTVELDIPDKQMGYILAAQQRKPCVCRVRLRSDATTTYSGILEQIDNVAHLNAKGESVVRASLVLPKSVLPESEPQAIRSGATVVAQVNCGEHSLGFVCFRGVVQWWRGLSW